MAATADAIGSSALVGDPPPRRRRAWPRRLRRPAVVVPGALLLAALIGVGDWVTGIELPFTILYLLPIGLAAWLAGRRAGLAVALLATASIALSLIRDRLTSVGVAWNVSGATLLFLLAVWAIDRLRGYVEHERALRRMAIDQLRHAERLNVIGTLAAGVAHELGTPLNVITGCAELIGEEVGDDKIRRRTRVILEQVAKVSGIIRRLLDFGHRGGRARARVDLCEVAASAVELLRSTAGKRGGGIQLAAAGPVWIEGNSAELEQVLSNLILNALQAMAGGTVRVRVGICARAEQRVGFAEVADDGCGIPAQNLGRIFDPFFTTKGIGEGTGLGLSVSYGIVRDHEGSIEVASEPGRGSTFTVLLPLAP